MYSGKPRTLLCQRAHQLADRVAVLALPGGGTREHRAALGVEPPAQQVHHVDQPGGQRAEFLGAQADAAVEHGLRRGAEHLAQPADVRGRNAGDRTHGLRRERLRQLAQPLQSVDAPGEVPELHAIAGEQQVHQREQQEGVGAGPDEEVPVGELRRLGAPRVDHDELAAAPAQRPEARTGVRRRHQAALRDERVAAHADEEVRAVDVGNREGPGAAVEQLAAQVLGLLVHRARGEEAPGVEQRDEELGVDLRAEVVAVRVAVVHRDGVLAMRRADRREPLAHQRERGLPLHLLPAIRGASHRPAQARGILVEVLDDLRLGAHVAARAVVLGVAAHRQHAVRRAVDLDREAAAGLAHRAGAEHGFRRLPDAGLTCGCGCHRRAGSSPWPCRRRSTRCASRARRTSAA